MMAGAPIIWKSHMQATISLSTTEAEYNALVYMGCEILYFFRLLSDLGQRAIVQGSKGDGDRAMAIRCDNKSTIAISMGAFNMRRTRHIEIRHKKVIEWVKAKLIKLVFVPSDENISDIFTKASRRAVFLQNRDVFMSRVQLANEPTIIENVSCFTFGRVYQTRRCQTCRFCSGRPATDKRVYYYEPSVSEDDLR